MCVYMPQMCAYMPQMCALCACMWNLMPLCRCMCSALRASCSDSVPFMYVEHESCTGDCFFCLVHDEICVFRWEYKHTGSMACLSNRMNYVPELWLIRSMSRCVFSRGMCILICESCTGIVSPLFGASRDDVFPGACSS
jgi:hypothetical protein